LALSLHVKVINSIMLNLVSINKFTITWINISVFCIWNLEEGCKIWDSQDGETVFCLQAWGISFIRNFGSYVVLQGVWRCYVECSSRRFLRNTYLGLRNRLQNVVVWQWKKSKYVLVII
jgi:hypothetical protein